MAGWWLVLLAQVAGPPDKLARFDLAKAKGTADPCRLDGRPEDLAGREVVVCGRRKNDAPPVKPIDWSERPIRAEVKLPGGIVASSTVDEHSAGPGVSAPAAMVHFKIKF